MKEQKKKVKKHTLRWKVCETIFCRFLSISGTLKRFLSESKQDKKKKLLQTAKQIESIFFKC